MDSIEELKRQRAKLLAKAEVKSEFAKRNAERKKLKKEILELKYGGAVAKGRSVAKSAGKTLKQTGRGLKVIGKGLAKGARTAGTNVARHEGYHQPKKKKQQYSPFF